MDINFQRAVDRMAGVPVCRLLSAWERLRGNREPVVPPRRILVILLSEMGSLVLAQPMFARLKELYPEASLHVMLFARNREVLDLLYVVPAENVITISDRSLPALAGDCIKALRGFLAKPFDVVIDCELFARVSSIFAYLSEAPVRVGFHPHSQEGLYRGSFINRPVLYNPYRHMTEQFLTMVAAIGSATVPKAKDSGRIDFSLPPLLQFPEDELQQLGKKLFADFPAIKGKRLVLVYASGGILPIRAWPLESYFQLCRTLLAEGYAVGVIGLPEDKPYGEAIKAHCRSEYCADLTGYTKSVRHLLGVFHFADLLISNDGGPGQFAALTPVSSIVFFGPETPTLYRTLTPNSYCFYLQLPCSPCLTAYNHRNSPCDGDNQCLKQVTTEQVLVKAREMLVQRVKADKCQSPS
jgi:ADP-heptose:LPS heptosyltransferase